MAKRNEEHQSPVYELPVAFEGGHRGDWRSPMQALEAVLAGLSDGEVRMVALALGAELVARGEIAEMLFTETCACDGLTLVDPVGVSEHHDADCKWFEIERPEYGHLTTSVTRAIVPPATEAPDGD